MSTACKLWTQLTQRGDTIALRRSNHGLDPDLPRSPGHGASRTGIRPVDAGGVPRIDDAECVAAELFTNSLRHTPSGSGGEVGVTISTGPGWARVAVSDAGTGDWRRAEAGKWDEYGRGLMLVEGLADKFGHDVTEQGQTMWTEFTWTADE